MEDTMDLEIWLNETFGSLDTSSSITELDPATEDPVPDSCFALHALPAHDVAITEGNVLSTEISTENIPTIIDPGAPLRTGPSLGEMTLVKRRTRRILRPIVEGNNRNGNKGKRRCLQCRTWKQKCEYDDIELPCKLCSDRGLPCPASGKVWGARRRETDISTRRVLEPSEEKITAIVPREVPTPDDDVLSQFEGMTIQWFHRIGFDWYFDPTYCRWASDILRGRRSSVFARFGPKLSSKVVRNAVILLCNAFPMPNRWANRRCQELEFRGRFYNHAMAAINNNCYADIVYASYAMCLYAGWGEIPKHFNGFLAAYEKLVTSADNDEVTTLKVLYTSLLNVFNILASCREETCLAHLASGNIARFIASTSRAVDLGDTIVPCQLSTEVRFQLLQMLLCHETTRRSSCPDRGLVLRAVKHHLRSLSRTIQSASGHLLLRLLQVLGDPPFQDTELVNSVVNLLGRDKSSRGWSSFLLRSCFFYLLSTVLFEGQCTVDNFEFPVVEASLMICRIVAVCIRTYYEPYLIGGVGLETRAICLAGVMLAELRLPDGIFC